MLFLSHLELGRYELIATAAAYSDRTVGFAFSWPWALNLLCLKVLAFACLFRHYFNAMVILQSMFTTGWPLTANERDTGWAGRRPRQTQRG